MRLINAKTLKLEEFVGNTVPEYAILSHTWGDGEVTFADMESGNAEAKAGYHKVVHGCRLAFSFGYSYVWIDTCCIDKKSSAELSEAINSMYKYYRKSGICFAHLADASPQVENAIDVEALDKCRWFYRSWTLQELIAPKAIHFYARDWTLLGTKDRLLHKLAEVTRIDQAVLEHEGRKAEFSVAQKMSWASERKATREEDLAYSLLGLFDVNMPMLYGEGMKAFTRLQEEIIKSSDDQSIFAWKTEPDIDIRKLWQEPRLFSVAFGIESQSHGFLASSPSDFQMSRAVLSYSDKDDRVYSMTNKGIQATFPRLSHGAVPRWQIIMLNCYDGDLEVYLAVVALPDDSDSGQLVRGVASLVRLRQEDISKYGFQRQDDESLFLWPTLPAFLVKGRSRHGGIYIKPSNDHAVVAAFGTMGDKTLRTWDTHLQTLRAPPYILWDWWSAVFRIQLKDSKGEPTGAEFGLQVAAEIWGPGDAAPAADPAFKLIFDDTWVFALQREQVAFVGIAQVTLRISITVRRVMGQSMYVVEIARRKSLSHDQWVGLGGIVLGREDEMPSSRFHCKRDDAWDTLMELKRE